MKIKLEKQQKSEIDIDQFRFQINECVKVYEKK